MKNLCQTKSRILGFIITRLVSFYFQPSETSTLGKLKWQVSSCSQSCKSLLSPRLHVYHFPKLARLDRSLIVSKLFSLPKNLSECFKFITSFHILVFTWIMGTLLKRRRGEFWYLKASSEERQVLFKRKKTTNIIGKKSMYLEGNGQIP